MSSELENESERLLKDYAKQRRADAGTEFELRPSLRKALQDEVDRAFSLSKKSRRSGFSWLLALGPRLAWGSALLVTLVIAVVVWLETGKSPQQLAKETSIDEQQRGLRNEVRDREPETLRREVTSPAAPAAESPSPSRTLTLAVEPAPQPPKPTPAQAPSAEANPDSKAVEIQTVRLLSEPSQVPELGRTSQTALDGLAKKTDEAALAAHLDRAALLRSGAAGLGGGRFGGGVPSQSMTSAVPTNSLALSSSPGSVGVTATRLTGALELRESGSTEEKLLLAKDKSNPNQNVQNSPVLSYEVPVKREPTAEASVAAGSIANENLNRANLVTQSVPSLGNNLKQRFQQVEVRRRNMQSPSMPKVLTSFQVEQNEDRLQIVDADGSVYDGQVNASPSVVEQTLNPQTKSTASDPYFRGGVNSKGVTQQAERSRAPTANLANETATPAQFSFTVRGTNRTLNQIILFQGNYLAATNLLPAPQNNIFNYQNNRSNLRLGQPPALQGAARNQVQPSPEGRIEGQAIIGGKDRIQINAVPAGP